MVAGEMGGLLDDLPNNASLHGLGLYLGFKLYNYASIVSNRVYQTFNPIPDGEWGRGGGLFTPYWLNYS